MSDFPVEVSAETPDSFDEMGSEIDALLAPPDEDITVKRSQLQKYAGELKTYRQRYGGYKQAFGDDADAEDVAALGQFYQALRSGDPTHIQAASAWIQDVIKELTPAEQAAVNAEIKAEAQATGQTQAEVRAALTPEDIEKLVDERANKVIQDREAKQAEEAAIASNVKKMQEVGAKLADEYGVPGFANPQSHMYGMLLASAQRVLNAEGGTVPEAMAKAAVQVLDELQQTSQAMLSKKKQTAGAGAKASPKAGVEPVGQSNKPKTMAEAHSRFRDRMDRSVGS